MHRSNTYFDQIFFGLIYDFDPGYLTKWRWIYTSRLTSEIYEQETIERNGTDDSINRDNSTSLLIQEEVASEEVSEGRKEGEKRERIK